MKKNQKQGSGLSRRLHFPEDEKRLPWLPMLLDAYSISDTGIAVVIRDTEKKSKTRLACARGCAVCCHQPDLPLYPHEIVGIYWYASEKITGPVREILLQQLAAHRPGSGCPFLIDNACSIHPVRPMGCRQFNVFGAPCSPGEDPYFTRRHDVLQPNPLYVDRAFAAVLPFYKLNAGKDASAAIRVVRAQIMNLPEFDWKKLADIMQKGTGPAGNPEA